jgi:hypothetical protein
VQANLDLPTKACFGLTMTIMPASGPLMFICRSPIPAGWVITGVYPSDPQGDQTLANCGLLTVLKGGRVALTIEPVTGKPMVVCQGSPLPTGYSTAGTTQKNTCDNNGQALRIVPVSSKTGPPAVVSTNK